MGVGEFTLMLEEWKSGRPSLSQDGRASVPSRTRRGRPSLPPPPPQTVTILPSTTPTPAPGSGLVQAEGSTWKVTGRSEVAGLVERAGRALGLGTRQETELREIALRLYDNWFRSAADLAHLTHGDAERLRMPLRLYQELQRIASAPASTTTAEKPLPSSLTTPATAESIDSTTITTEMTKANNGRAGLNKEEEKNKKNMTKRKKSGPAKEPNDGLIGAVNDEQAAPVEEGKGEHVTTAAMSGEDAGKGVEVAEEDRSQKAGDGGGGGVLRRAGSMRLGRGGASQVRLVERRKDVDRSPYSLRPSEMGPALTAQLVAFRRFLTSKFYGQQESPVGLETAAMYEKNVLLLLGWLHRHREVAPTAAADAALTPTPPQNLTLGSLFPSSSRESATVAYEYVHWMVTARGCTPNGELKALHSLVALAKFLFHKESKADPAEGDKPYSDLGIVRELRRLASDAAARAKIAPKTANERAKWLDWPEYLRCVELLQQECAERAQNGIRRPATAVAHSFQLYLMFSILSCVPDRQRTLRELEIGKTLVKTEEPGGEVRWEIRHGPGDYKTGKIYGERPPLLIAPHIYPFLEEYLAEWRPHLEPRHNLVFSKKNGGKPDAKWVYAVFSSAAFRLTGKRTNPHLVRDMIVTFLRDTNASERELEALAIYMGHSLQMQKTTYDRRTKQQKVAPAVQLIHSIKATTAAFPQPLTKRPKQ